ncbi:MAG: UDP-3-O-(3-hydroxymyristoyl)glucosamine N-acyltransferase [Pseudomonadota bacterium]|nr:UDP-3-O-(3-hydroxymyristoyl)glucosamine N-acyltransferase [Pseudomonadota bacterium]
MSVRVRLADLSCLLGGELIGTPDAVVTRLGPLATADSTTLCFVASVRYAAHLAASDAGCVIVAPALREAAAARGAAIVCADPQLAWARVTQWWVAQGSTRPVAGIHPSAVIEAGARIDANASIGALCFIGRGAVIAEQAVIGAQCVVGEEAEVGAATWLKPRVSFLHGCRIGARGIVHSGAVIGADGFGYAPEDGGWTKIEQLGTVVLGDDVEIGANTCIDRGALEATVIGDGVKIDNLVQIAHNVQVGDHTAMAACTGIAGSTRIGRHCTFGGAAMVVGHIEIADHVHISGGALVSKSIRKPGLYSGSFPIDDNAAWEKNAATLRQLHGLRERLRALERAREDELKKS